MLNEGPLGSVVLEISDRPGVGGRNGSDPVEQTPARTRWRVGAVYDAPRCAVPVLDEGASSPYLPVLIAPNGPGIRIRRSRNGHQHGVGAGTRARLHRPRC